MRRRPFLIGAALALASLSGFGCLFAADLVNTNVLAALGVDTRSLDRSGGNVIVAFTNNTDTIAVFQLYQADDPTDLSLGVRTSQVAVDPGGTVTATNEVITCPTGGIGLGLVAPSFQVTETGAFVNAAAVPYTGGILAEGNQYKCGDLISFTVSPVAGQAAGFVITTQVIPGR